jgi:hypothetical protein
MNYTIQKFALLAFIMFLKNSCLLMAQETYTILDQSNTFRKLSIKPYMGFGISPVNSDVFAVQLNLDAQYWLNDKLDIRAGSHSGNFTGGALGITYYLSNRVVSKSQKFIISESTETHGNSQTTKTNYYKAKGNLKKIKGIAIDVKTGVIPNDNKENKLYSQIDFGVDFQSFARNYYEKSNGDYYPSNRNGWNSFKLQGVIGLGQKFALGAVGTLQASRRPWKGVTMYLSIPLGILKTFGSNGEIIPIISPSFGFSINLIKNKSH